MKKLTKEIQKICKKSKLVGANVALFDNNQILYSYNYGYINKAENLKSTNDRLYMIGSNTKVMTALGIFKLLEDGMISLDDDVRKFIPEFEVKSTFDYDKITIENLLMHRSGLINDMFDLILDNTRDYHEVLDELKETYLTAVPGHMFSYSNVGYTVLGIVIERVSGLAYPEYIKKAIAEPLGIGIHFLKTAEERKVFSSNISLSYNKKGKVMEDWLSTMFPAGSNTYMSMNDFVKFGQIFLNKDNTIFKNETLELMETLNVKESIDNELMNVGYGLIHNQYNYGKAVGKVLGHGGDTTCHHSIFNYIPSLNIGVAVFTNSEQAAGVAGILGAKTLTEYLKKQGLISGKSKTEHKHIQANCEQYMGRYATPLGLIDITQNNKHELVTKISKLSVKLVPCEDGFLQCCPNSLLLKLPPFKRQINGMRFKLINYGGEELMMIEQPSENNKIMGIMGCRYEENAIPKSFKDACGSYEVVNEGLNHISCKCSLSIENGALILRIDALSSKFISCLKVVDDNLAVAQGFGRNARLAVPLREEEDGFYLTYSGIVFKKARDKK